MGGGGDSGAGGGKGGGGKSLRQKLTGGKYANAAAGMALAGMVAEGVELFSKSAEERKSEYDAFTARASESTVGGAMEGAKNPILAVSTLADTISGWWDASSAASKQEEANKIMEAKLIELKKQKAQKAGGQTQKQNEVKAADAGKPESQKVSPVAGAGVATAVATTVAAQKIQDTQTTKPSLTSPVQQQQAVKTATKAAVETAVKVIPSAAAASSGGAAGGRASAAGAAGGSSGGLEGNVATILPNGEVQFTVRGFDQIMAQFKQQTVRSTK